MKYVVKHVLEKEANIFKMAQIKWQRSFNQTHTIVERLEKA